jgi:cobalt-zinc-cadmium efflux system membrane fusion protein
MRIRLKAVLLGFAVLALAACGGSGEEKGHEHGEGEEHAEEEMERGPHGGRLLRDGPFALEVTIYEEGVPPQYRLYAFNGDKPLAPATVAAKVMLTRLGGSVDTFSFRPEQDYLVGDGVVEEPHSFDVRVTADHAGKRHSWAYDSYEGRTTIAAAAAAQAGIKTEKAGAATIAATVEVLGRVAFAPGAEASAKARFPGKILSMTRNVGDTVRAGEVLARVESNESLQSYLVTAPISGVVVERGASPGDIAGDEPIYRLGDTGRLVADFHIFDRDMGKVRPGQAVKVSPMHGSETIWSRIATFLPVKEVSTQTVVARAPLAIPNGGWFPGMTVRGLVVVEEAAIPLAVRATALQRFRDFEVVFAKVGDTYEVRMLEIGRRTEDWVEVLGGLRPGEEYVAENSFLIKADIEKSGASHDH